MTLVQRLLVLVAAILAILVSVGIHGVVVFRDARETSVKRELAQTLAFVSYGYGRFVERTHNSLLIASLEASHAVADASVCQALVGSLAGPGLLLAAFRYPRCARDRPMLVGSRKTSARTSRTIPR